MFNTVRYKNQNLYLGDTSLSKIAKKHGTPTYVYSKDRILEKLDQLVSAFTLPLQVHYALKANSFRPLLKMLAAKGCGVDVVSGGEIKRALETGFLPSKVIFSGVAKNEEEIEFALKKKIFAFNVESPQELERIGKLASKSKITAQISFRLNPNVNPKTHPYITTGFKQNKFGMDKSFIPELLRILKKSKYLKLTGLDFHIGSQLLEIAPFEEALVKSLPIYKNLQSMGYPLKHFDIGGGIGISYQGQKTINLKQYAQRLEKHLRPLGCKILCEPGRFLVADSGVLLTQVEYIKKTPYKNFVIINTGMHHLIRPALYGSFHNILPVKKHTGKLVKADVVGPICESSDFLAKDRKMVLPQQGDILAVCDAGAYGFVMAGRYNLHPMPKEILI